MIIEGNEFTFVAQFIIFTHAALLIVMLPFLNESLSHDKAELRLNTFNEMATLLVTQSFIVFQVVTVENNF